MIVPGETAALAREQDDTADMVLIGKALESENPLWIVVFGIYSRQFVAFPRFSVPNGTMAVARYPAALCQRMRRIEEQYAWNYS